MSALSIRHMNFTLQAREQIQFAHDAEQYRRGDIIEQLTSSMTASNKFKRNELGWARAKEKDACAFCKMAFRHHRNEMDVFEQLTVLASIEAGTQ